MIDVGALVHPSDDVEELGRWAHGSELLARAFHHVPVVKRAERALEAPLEAGLDAAFASIVDRAKAAGCVVRASPNHIGLHATTALGRPRKHPTLALGISDNAIRPFFVAAPGDAGRNFGSVARAGAYLFELLERFTP